MSWRQTSSAVSRLRIPRWPSYFAQFDGELPEVPPPSCGFHVAKGISRSLIETYEKRYLQTVDSALSVIFRAISSRYKKCRPITGFRVINCVPRNFVEMREMLSRNCGFRGVDGLSRNFVENYEKLRPQTGFRVVDGLSRNFIVMQEMLSSSCGFRVFNGNSCDFIEIRGMPSPICGFSGVYGISHNFMEKYQKRRLFWSICSFFLGKPVLIRRFGGSLSKRRISS